MTKNDIQRLWKDLRESAREFASYGLEASSKALDFTANRLSSWKQEVSKKAEEWAPPKAPPSSSEHEKPAS